MNKETRLIDSVPHNHGIERLARLIEERYHFTVEFIPTDDKRLWKVKKGGEISDYIVTLKRGYYRLESYSQNSIFSS